jgi:orotate phosphoribosyltransferase
MDDLIEALSARRGHFRLESGHHGELWLDLDALFARPANVAPFVARLAELLSPLGTEVVCGPLVGGAFVAQAIAAQLGLECSWTERVIGPSSGALDAVRYRIPDPLRERLRGRTVAIVDDVITPARPRERRSPTCGNAARARSRSAPCSSSAPERPIWPPPKASR